MGRAGNHAALLRQYAREAARKKQAGNVTTAAVSAGGDEGGVGGAAMFKQYAQDAQGHGRSVHVSHQEPAATILTATSAQPKLSATPLNAAPMQHAGLRPLSNALLKAGHKAGGPEAAADTKAQVTELHLTQHLTQILSQLAAQDIDPDGDGKISKKDWDTLYDKMMKMDRDGEVFLEMDEDADGKVSPEEWVAQFGDDRLFDK